MANIIQNWDKFTGDPTTGYYVCRLVVPVTHQLKAAWVYVLNVVMTGVVTVRLRFTDPMGPRGGGDAAEILDNDDLTAASSINARYNFILLDTVTGFSPAQRSYFIHLLGTNSADRFDEPLLVVEYDAV